MGNENASPSPESAGKTLTSIYEFRVKGCLDKMFWSDWFGDLDFTMDLDHGETCLRTPVADQAELYGLLSRLRNKGLTLVSVQEVHVES